MNIEDIIDSIDIVKEVEKYLESHNAYIKDEDYSVEYWNGDTFNHTYDLEKMSKYFLEYGIKLGLSAMNGEKVGMATMDEEIKI